MRPIRRSPVSLLTAAVVTVAGAVLALPVAPASAAPVRVMPLGDSITGGPGCWRALLWSRLQATGYTDVDFVGTLPGGGCGLATWDGENEGHGGALAINVANENLLTGWLSTTRPDVVMMHFGTNDIWNRRPVTDILAAYSTLVGQMRASNPAMKILVAQIIPVAPPGCAECQQLTIDLNNAIPGWARSLTTTQSPITVVDHWTGWDPATDTIDGVHQSDAGNQKMADRWYPALTAVLGGVAPTTTPTTTTTTTTTTRPSTTTTTTSQGPGGCAATFAVSSSWSGGFVASVRVVAGGSAINGWRVTMVLPGGATVANLWNGVATGTSGTVPVNNAVYNGVVPAGQSTEFGFQGTGSAAGTSVTCAVA